MNDDELRDQLHRAVADVHPTSRLDEIVGSRPSSSRGPQVMAIAAAVLVLAALAVAVATRPDRDSTVTADEPTPSTTTSGDARAMVVERVQVPAELLPEGFRLVDERDVPVRVADDDLTITVLRFAASPASYNEGGPALRIALLPNRAWVEAVRGVAAIEAATPDYDEVMWIPDPYTPPGTEAVLTTDDGPWTHLARSEGLDLLLTIDGRAVDGPTLDAIAKEAMAVP